VSGSYVPVLQAALARIDTGLAGDPSPELLIERAQLLAVLGRTDEALNQYAAVLTNEPSHLEALTAVGTLLLGRGQAELARTFLCAAIARDPGHAPALANVGCFELLGGRLDAAGRAFEAALRIDPTLPLAHRGLGDIAQRRGDAAATALHRERSRCCRPLTTSQYIGAGPPLSVLALSTTACGNIVTDQFFDNRVVLLSSLAVDQADSATPLPPHDLVFNTISDADLCSAELATAAAIVGRSSAPVINHPAAVAATGRAANARRLAGLEGVAAPRIRPVRRADLTGPRGAAFIAERGFDFPLLVRTPGFHRGAHFVKVDAVQDLSGAVAPLPGDVLLLIEFLDTRDADGLLRKHRVIIVDGQLYPVHLAISRHWKVHYFSADMEARAEHRAHDAAFLADMERTLGSAAVAALGQIAATLDLDYGGIDFAIDRLGRVAVFEANAAMVAALPNADACWNYRRAPIRRIRGAVRAMIRRRASGLPRAAVNGQAATADGSRQTFNDDAGGVLLRRSLGC
jgi:hypothetical protein